MQKDKIFKTILLFCIPLLVLSCSKTAGDDSPGQDANLALALITRSENGDLAITGEDRFTSLAVYIFNNDNGDPGILRTDHGLHAGIVGKPLHQIGPGNARQKGGLCDRQLCRPKLYGSRTTGNDHRADTPVGTRTHCKVAFATFAGNDIVMVGKR